MEIELQILLGLNCNFKCSHCLNNSAPGNVSYDLKNEHFGQLVNDIESEKKIKLISFSGGEPLLYIDNISELIGKIRSLRPDIQFSITTNGFLLKKYALILSDLKINHCVLSFDKEHNEYFNIHEFKKHLILSKSIFGSISVNMTHSQSDFSSELYDFLLEENTKVNFNEKIYSGRNKTNKIATLDWGKISCPNLDFEYIKLTYAFGLGYTLCCGPILFDKILDSSIVFFKDFSKIKNNILFRFFEKAKNVDFLITKNNSCNSCKSLLKNETSQKISMFLNENPWENILELKYEPTLSEFNSLFNPKIVYKLSKNVLSAIDDSRSEFCELTSISGDFLTEEEILEFSDFTIESFYKVHTSYYGLTDISRFKKEQGVFFKLPFKFINHKINGKLVATLVVCLIEEHGYFNEAVWHIGYWGISASITDRNLRNFIKNQWATKLSELNSQFPIVANVDYFNKSAINLAEKYNFLKCCLRLDPKV